MRVVLEGLCDCYGELRAVIELSGELIAGPGGGTWPYESTTALEKKLVLDLGGEILEAGDHA